MRPSEPHTGSAAPAAAGAHTGPHRSSSRGRPGLALGAGGVAGVEEAAGVDVEEAAGGGGDGGVKEAADVEDSGAGGGGDGGDAPASGSSAE